MVKDSRIMSPGVGDPYFARYSEDRRQWYVVSWLGGLAHQDGRAAFFDGQAEADAFAIELCRGHWFELQARKAEADAGR